MIINWYLYINFLYTFTILQFILFYSIYFLLF